MPSSPSGRVFGIGEGRGPDVPERAVRLLRHRSAGSVPFRGLHRGHRFMDLHWPEVCLIEMKAPHVPVETAHPRSTITGASHPTRERPARRPLDGDLLVPGVRDLGAGQVPDQARLCSSSPSCRTGTTHSRSWPVRRSSQPSSSTITSYEGGGGAVARVFQSLVGRSAAPPDEIQRFVLQTVWCMFAEDLGMLDNYPMQARSKSCPATRPGRRRDRALVPGAEPEGRPQPRGRLAEPPMSTASCSLDPPKWNSIAMRSN